MTRPATTRRTVAGAVPRQVRRPAPASTTSRVHVQTRGSVDPRDVGYARYKVNAAMEHVRDPILLARVRLTELRDPSLARPSLAQANLDLDGVQVRAQVAAATLHEAVDALQERLMRRLDRVSRDWQAQRGGRPREGEWRRETPASAHPPYFPRPAEDRQVVRHKTFAVARETVEEAAFDMELLDYGFHLFTEEGSGVDSVLYRVG
jgi:ribosome-associated translation inhibitor RaiA